ncbi:hypothetical protein M9Y10_014109 [Tritrichomonas musculus]|uniref:DUF3447 domain-containing protein n=1 Tax=Tritrichomonas musculus TaxID=1915356 RepID=A0ABR2KYN7_9EUKA
MGKIQKCILGFLDEEGEETEQRFRDLESLLISKTNQLDKYDLKSVLYLISKITKNHYRSSVFFDKTKEIITILKDQIKQTFSNSDIFHIFKNNKLVLLILFNEGILLMDENILNFIQKKKNFREYFQLEIEGKSDEYFEEKRRQGENESYLCDLIRNDNIADFVVYYNKNMISPDLQIKPSIFETNSFLLKREPTLIEYSVFYGSIEIFNFLRMSKAEMNSSLWLYSIHGRNPEIIRHLEENKIEVDDRIYEMCLK